MSARPKPTPPDRTRPHLECVFPTPREHKQYIVEGPHEIALVMGGANSGAAIIEYLYTSLMKGRCSSPWEGLLPTVCQLSEVAIVILGTTSAIIL
jgi:hypothetical protein